MTLPGGRRDNPCASLHIRIIAATKVTASGLGLRHSKKPSRFVMLGQQGVGKSSIANALLGFDNLKNLGRKKKLKR